MNIVKKLLIAALKGYRLFISPVLPPSCGYYPTCSQYAVEAVEKYGALKGMWLGSKRLLRCTPFHKGGPDPVP